MRNTRIVAVTGGTGGIGRAITELFQSRGDQVVVGSRSSEEGGLPSGVVALTLDVRSREQVEHFVEEVVRRLGRLDLFVNCAGVSRWRAVDRIDDDFAAEILETNLLGTLWGCAAAARVMGPGSCIINISSLAGKRGSANNVVYCAAKFAVNGITQALAKELGPRGIRVNAVCPVYVATERLRSSLSESDSPAQGKGVESYLESFASTQTALGRLPTAQEVAEAAYYLSGPAASAITGQCLNVDCGTLPQ